MSLPRETPYYLNGLSTEFLSFLSNHRFNSMQNYMNACAYACVKVASAIVSHVSLISSQLNDCYDKPKNFRS